LDERYKELSGKPEPSRPLPSRRRLPYGVLSLLALMMISAFVMSSFVLPRVGPNATVTSFFEEDLNRARELRDLERAARRQPDAENLLALADAYWQVGELETAEETYLRMVNELQPVPATAYKRLGFLTIQQDLEEAEDYLSLAREADAEDIETLYTLGELRFALGDLLGAKKVWEEVLAQPQGSGDEEVMARLELVDAVMPLQARLAEDASEANLLALAGAFWRFEERERAADLYVRVLTENDPHNALALSRIGQLLFFRGRNEEAIQFLERSREVDPSDKTTLLFLGNGYFSLERYRDAIDVWEAYVELAGSDDAGRVPDLIASARARLEGGLSATGSAGQTVEVAGPLLYSANCALCHGSEGQGISAPRLAGNRRAADQANVRNIIQYGRGLMPGFGVRLSEAELELLTLYVTGVIATPGTSNR
jgi:tetratricopeptide (TPR) repeat protein